jgi:hypothetical protein
MGWREAVRYISVLTFSNPAALANRFSSPQNVTPPLVWHLTNTYPFNQDPTTVVYLTDSELRAQIGEEQYAKMVSSRIEQKRRAGLKLAVEDEEFLRAQE